MQSTGIIKGNWIKLFNKTDNLSQKENSFFYTFLRLRSQLFSGINVV